MNRLGRALVVSALGLAALPEGLALAQEGKSKPAKSDEAESALNVDGKDVATMSKIEDASIEGLLDMDLEDQLGRTEAISRMSESILRAPATLTTIHATQIRLSGASTVPDVLRSVPGLAVFRNAPGNYVVSLRGTGGLASNNVILLVDGIPLNNPLDGTVSWDLVPLHVEDIERIEVVRGPVSPAYGANAYTGVVNIVSKTSVGLTPSYVGRLRGGANTRGGSAGSASGRFLQIGKATELKWFVNAEHDSTAADPAVARGPVHDEKPLADRLALMAALTLRPNKISSTSVEVGQVWSRRSGMDHLTLASEPESRHLFFGRVLYELHDETALFNSARFWAQGISLGIRSQQDELTGFSYDGAQSLRGVAGTDLSVPVARFLTVQFGGQGALERVEGPFLHPNVNAETRPTYGYYARLKATPLRSLDLMATARGDLAPISASLEYSYRASAIYHTDTWGLRLTGASAFRTPTYVEATGRLVDPSNGLILLEGRDSIEAPRNSSLELGANFSPHSRLIVTSTAYLSRLSNLMIEDFDSVVRRTFRNDPEARTYLGVELEATWQLADAVSVLPSFSVLNWLQASESIDTNVGVPSQNSQYLAGLRLQGLFGDETWGYGVGASLASSRHYNVRSGIPPLVLSSEIPTSARFSATLEHQLFAARSIWGSLRLVANLPGDEPESPLPLAAPAGQSAILGVELRRE